MHYYSHTDINLKTTFKDALLASLADDGGLWMPSVIPSFTDSELINLAAMNFSDCAAYLSKYFVGDQVNSKTLTKICHDAYDFELPIKTILGDKQNPSVTSNNQDYILELFHGPTLAFKDFAARFMARCTSEILSKSLDTRTILVATSGDTGGAIGEAFLNQKNINVIILFPKNGVSKVQEQQLCTIGNSRSNIQAVKVDGTFDDCQQLVKDAFSNKLISKKFSLMSANSINVGRVIPQSFYYLWSSLQVKATNPNLPIVYSIPSGNLGNLTGGLIAKKMGAPIDRFVIGNNANDPFVRYLKSGHYDPLPSISTLSNAMDIGRPNNFPRILELYSNNYDNITDVCKGFSFSDSETEIHIKKIFNETGYIMCPHTAVGHLAMIEYRNKSRADFIGVTVATAHPSKFTENVDRIIGHETEMPIVLKSIYKKKKMYKTILPRITELEAILSNSIL